MSLSIKCPSLYGDIKFDVTFFDFSSFDLAVYSQRNDTNFGHFPPPKKLGYVRN